MKIRFNKDHLDFKEGKEYDVTPDSVAVYLIRLKVAKEVMGKDGKPPVKKEKTKVETKELKTPVENK